MNLPVYLSLAVILGATAPALAQDAPLPVEQSAVTEAPAMVLPANTAVMLRMNQDLSSKTAKEGSMFDLSVAQAVMVDNYVVIPANARAVGEVTWLTGKGAFGKSGKMNVELRYIEVAGRRLPITGSFRQEGEGNTAATIGGVIAAGVFAGFITGKTAIIPAGRELQAFTKTDIALAPPRRVAPAYAPAAPAAASYASAGPVRATPTPPAPVKRGAMVDPSLEITVR